MQLSNNSFIQTLRLTHEEYWKSKARLILRIKFQPNIPCCAAERLILLSLLCIVTASIFILDQAEFDQFKPR